MGGNRLAVISAGPCNVVVSEWEIMGEQYHVINGQRIYTRQEGPPSGQVALLVHGWSSSWYAMSPLLPLLSKRFCCLAVDLPGYGNSPPTPKPATIGGYADMLAALIQTVTDQPVVLVGHSMGGMISLTLARRYPMLVERMVLLCPTISGRLSTFINFWVAPITFLEQFAVTGKLISLLEPHLLELTDRLMKPASFAERSGISERDYRRLREDARRPGQGRVRAQCFRAMRAGDLTGKLNQIEAPALILWGAEDNTVPLRDAGVVVDEYHHADLRIIPKAGHWPHFETPEVTQRYIAAYLGLPQISGGLKELDSPAAAVHAAAEFLAHSDVGNGLNLVQRTRLAAQCHIRSYQAGEVIARANEPGDELYIVQEGTIEVWSDPAAMAQTFGTALAEPQRLANVLPGQISGELALLDGGRRSAHIRAGPEGATVLILERERLVGLCNDDPVLGNRLLWNIATTLALRLRLTNWQLRLESRGLELEKTGR